MVVVLVGTVSFAAGGVLVAMTIGVGRITFTVREIEPVRSFASVTV